MANVQYVLVDEKSGLVTLRASVPGRMYDSVEVPPGQRLVRPIDGKLPASTIKIDMRKARKPRNEVASIESVLSARQPAAMPPEQVLEISRAKAIASLDRRYAGLVESLKGPLGALHAEKRRQAEAGAGPLVADEADRQEILANAAAQDVALAALERLRREIKARLRDATTEDEIKAILADI